ncbi:DNA primase [Patescibacteria group bacterium]|nr:DNA primase [Patescibacteria group bacterium]MCG2694838.1 DNA primase [Candidatus Parcubacteria bacterium]
MPNDNVSQIKDRLNIVDVVGAYLKLNKAGGNFKANCPFHNEKTPSFFVSPERGTYKCFGCGAGGDIFTFVEQFEGVDFPGALKILAEKAGVELVKENPKKRDETNRLYLLMDKTTLYFENNLKSNSEALKYLKNRGVKDETIEKFRLGYAKNDWRDLCDYLKKDNFSDEEMEKVGLIKKPEQGGNYYDRFRGRIIFPIFDASGRIIAFSGRLFEGDEEQAKYLNSPETVLFSKSRVLYGYNFAKTDIRKRGFVILVEGQMDIIMSHQVGFTNTVATSGTALTGEHLLLLKRLSDKITMAFDGDSAGLNAANKGAKLALGMGMEVKFVEILNNSDPADLILKDTKDWINSLKNSVHIIEFNLNNLIRQESDGRKLGLKIKDVVLPLVLELKSKIEQDHFISKISLKTGISEDILWEELNIIEKGEEVMTDFHSLQQKRDNQMISKEKKAIREISGILHWQKSMKSPFLEIEKIENRLKSVVGEDLFDKIINLPKDVINEIIFEAEMLYTEIKNLESKLDELFLNLEKEILMRKRDILGTRLKEENDDGDKILKEISEISKKIESIK